MNYQKPLRYRHAAWQVRFLPNFSSLIFASLFVFGLLAPFSAGAQYVFTGASGVNFEWSNPNNWDANGYPGAMISAGQTVSIQANCTMDIHVTNSGSITVEAMMTMTIHFSDTLTNHGTVLNNGTLTFTNTGVFDNETTGTLTNQEVINLSGILNNLGTFNNHQALNISSEGDFFNTGGTFNNHDVLTNDGAVSNKSGGTFSNLSGAFVHHNNGQFLTENAGSTTSNAGTFNCADYFDVFNGGSFTNSGTFSNATSIDVNANFTNATAGSLTNNGSIQVGGSGSLTNNGALTNATGSLSVSGLLTNNNILTNSATATLTVTSGKNIVNNDTLTNHNVFNVNGICKTNAGAKTINHANLTVGASGQFILDGGTTSNLSSLTNNGYVEIKNGGALSNPIGSTVVNGGQMVIFNPGSVTNGGSFSSANYVGLESGGTFTNTGTMTNSGSFDVNGSFANQSGASVNNTGSLQVGSSGSLTNDGSFFNQTGGVLNNTGAFANNFLLVNDQATLTVGANKTLNNNDSLYNDGIVNIHGTLKINPLSAFVNDSTVNVSASGTLLVDSAIFQNNLLVASLGAFEAKRHATVNNPAGATVTNGGDVQINTSSVLTNHGEVATSDYFSLLTGGVFNNHDTLTNTGSFDLNATLTNFPTGVVNNSASFHNTSNGTLTNNGKVFNLAGTFTQNGVFDNNELLDNDATLNVGAGKTLDNDGHVENDGVFNLNGTLNNNSESTFDNDSTLTIAAAAYFISTNGDLTNNDSLSCLGNLDVKSGSILANAAGAVLNNAGQMLVHDTLTLFTNAGSFINSDNFLLSNLAVFTNSGSVVNSANFEVGAAMTNQATGTVTNSAMFHLASSGNLANNGTITNQATGTINDTGTFTNNDSLSNLGIFAIGAGKIFTNNGSVVNAGVVNDNGTFNHNATATLTNNGTVNVAGTGKLFVSGGSVTNSGTVDVQFLMEIKAGGTFTNQAGATLSNDGQVVVFDTLSLLSNSGTVNNFDFFNNFSYGGVTNSGVFNNKPTGSADNNGFFVNSAGDTLRNEGTFNNASSSPLLNHGVLLNAAAAVFHNNGPLVNNDSIANNGTLHNNNSRVITNNAIFLNNNLLNNTGTLKTTAAGTLVNAAGTLSNNGGGNLVVEGGDLTNLALVTNLGTIDVKSDGSFLNQASGVVNNANQVMVSDTASFDNAGTFSTTNFTFVEIGSTFTNAASVTNSASFDAGGVFNNQAGATLTNQTGGTFDVKANALLTNLNQITNAAGANFINSGVLVDNDTLTNLGTYVNNGVLKGTGVFVGNLSNTTSGTVAPGASPGTLTVDGNFSNAGMVEIELGGTTPGAYDTLVVNDTAFFSATLQVNLHGGFVPVVGDTFIIMTADTVADQFAAVNFPSLAGITWTITYLPTIVRIQTLHALPACTNLTSPVNNATNVPVTSALTWAAASGFVTGYRLNVGTTNGGIEILDHFDVGNVTTFNPPGNFLFDTTIFVRIIPYNATGDVQTCPQDSFHTEPSTISCTNLTSPANAATNVPVTSALTWATATGNPLGYRLTVGTTSGGSDILNNFDVGNVTTYDPAGDFPYATTIFVKIVPYNASGDAVGCAEESFTTQTFLPACTNLSSPANAATNVPVTSALTWATPTGIPTGYRLTVGTTSGGADILNNFDVGNVTTFNPAGDFPFNMTIFVKITPYNANGDAAGCSEESFTTQIAPPACTNLTSPANGATNVPVTSALTWAAASGNPTGYRLTVGTTSGGSNILNNFDVGNVTTYDPPGNLPSGSTIFVKITPYNATGDAAGCSEESFTTQIGVPSCTNLTSPANNATNVAVTSALTWAAAPGNPTGYRLTVGTTSGGTDILNNVDVGNVTTFNPAGDFSFNTTIFVKITPYNGTGDAVGCSEESFTTQIAPPACTNLTNPANNATNVAVNSALTWAAAPGSPTGYRLTVGTTSGGNDILDNFDVGNVTTFNPAGDFSFNTTIFVKIIPYNGTGDAVGCSEESFTTQIAPPACTNLTSPANNATDVPVTSALTWAAATGSPTGYRLTVGTTSGGTDILNNFDVGNVTTHNPPGDFPSSTTIFVKITPYNATGDAAGCSEESFTTQIGVPSCTNLTSPANNATNVAVTSALTWAAAPGSPTGYRLTVGTTSGGTDILNNVDVGNVTTFNPAGDFPFGTTIFVKITPYNGTGDAAGCSQESFTTQIAPPACTNLTSPANGATNVAVTSALTWAASGSGGAPTGYRLTVGTTSGGTDILNNVDVGNVTTFNPAGDFPFAMTIFVKITPYNGTGNAAGCSEESFTTQIAPPACTNLTSPANGATNVPATSALTWSAASGSPTGYRLTVGTTSGGTDILNNFDVGNVTTFNPAGDFPFSTTIFVKITPYNATGNAAACTEESFTTENSTVPACTNLTSPANGATNVALTAALTWAAATGSPTGYRLDVGTFTGGTDILNNFDVGNVTTYNPPGNFPNNATIFVKIKPYNAGGSATGCAEESFTTQVCIPNLTIENIVIPGGTYRSQGDLTSNVATVALGSTVTFKSDTGILLQSTFTVQLGATFDALIEACPTNVDVEIPEEK